MLPATSHEVREFGSDVDPEASERDAGKEHARASEPDAPDAQLAESQAERRHKREDEHGARYGVAAEEGT